MKKTHEDSQVQNLSRRRLRLVIGDVDLPPALDKPRDSIGDEAWQKHESGGRGREEREVFNPQSGRCGFEKMRKKMRQKLRTEKGAYLLLWQRPMYETRYLATTCPSPCSSTKR